MRHVLLASVLVTTAAQPLAAAPPYRDLPTKDLPPPGTAQHSQVVAEFGSTSAFDRGSRGHRFPVRGS